MQRSRRPSCPPLVAEQTTHPPTLAPLRCDVVAVGEGVVWLAPVGELDLATAHDLDRDLRAARVSADAALVVDLRGLAFIDCAGLNVLREAAAWARDAGVEFRLIRGPRAVHRLFELTGFDHELPFIEMRPASPGPSSLNGRRRGSVG